MFRKYVTSIIDDYINKPKLNPNKEYVMSAAVEEDFAYEEVINFSLTPAVGGRILRSTRRNKQGDRETQLYVIPSGEDVGERVAKILNLELIK